MISLRAVNNFQKKLKKQNKLNKTKKKINRRETKSFSIGINFSQSFFTHSMMLLLSSNVAFAHSLNSSQLFTEGISSSVR